MSAWRRSRVYVTNCGFDTVSVIDTATSRMVDTVAGLNGALGVAISL